MEKEENTPQEVQAEIQTKTVVVPKKILTRNGVMNLKESIELPVAKSNGPRITLDDYYVVKDHKGEIIFQSLEWNEFTKFLEEYPSPKRRPYSISRPRWDPHVLEEHKKIQKENNKSSDNKMIVIKRNRVKKTPTVTTPPTDINQSAEPKPRPDFGIDLGGGSIKGPIAKKEKQPTEEESLDPKKLTPYEQRKLRRGNKDNRKHKLHVRKFAIENNARRNERIKRREKRTANLFKVNFEEPDQGSNQGSNQESNKESM